MENILIGWIGGKIRSLRKQRNQSLHVLSERSQISKGLLSKIENNRTIPSMPVFLNILNGLDTSPKEFFEDLYFNDGGDYKIVRKEDRQLIQKENRHGLTYQSIINQSISNFSIDIVHLTIDPHTQYKPTSTDGYEFKLVLSGEIEYVIGNEIIELREGDSIFFDARTLHYPKSHHQEATLLVVYFLF